MHPERQVRAAINSLAPSGRPGPFSRFVAYRHLVPHSAGSPPAAGPKPLYGMGSVAAGGRFTPRGSFETVYLAEDPITALAEVSGFFRGHGGIVFTVRTIPVVHVAVDAILLAVLDLTLGTVQTALGTTRMELTGDWRSSDPGVEPPTHMLGRVCFEDGRFDAIRFYSARNPPDGVCVAVFPERLKKPGFLEVFDPYGHLAQRLP